MTNLAKEIADQENDVSRETLYKELGPYPHLTIQFINWENGVRSPQTFVGSAEKFAAQLVEANEKYYEEYKKFEQELEKVKEELEEKGESSIEPVKPREIAKDFILVLAERYDTGGPEERTEVSNYPLVKVSTFINTHHKESN
jgi:hypothetical protein